MAKKIVLLNQAVNYLTVGYANAFSVQFDEVVLICGGIHEQGEALKETVKVHQINKWVEFPAKKKAVSYLLAMFKMWWLCSTKYRSHEVFFISVPPMAYLLNLVLRNRFSMIIWDLYPDIFKITAMKESHIIYKTWSYLNRRSFKKAHKIFTISDKMAEIISNYVPPDKIIVQPIWSIFQNNNKTDKKINPFIKAHQLKGKFIVQYSGNIGITHDVETMLEIADQLNSVPSILFQIIGRGPRKEELERLVQERNLENCKFLPFQSDAMFPHSLSAADIGIVILNEKVSKGSVPSKSYNLMIYGIPSLYISSKDSQLSSYVNQYKHGACYSKTELKAAAHFILKLYNDSELYNSLSKAAEVAAKDFKRVNADQLVIKYQANSI